MLDRKLIEKEFGFFGDNIYLNVSARSMPPLRVQEAYCGYMRDYVKNMGKDVNPRSWKLVNEGRESIAQLLHANGGNEIAFTKNTSEGTAIIANGFPFEAGDNIVIADEEHPSNLFPWINMHERKGLGINAVPCEEDDINEDRLIAAMNSRTRLLSVSAIQYGSGFAVDLEKLGSACRKRGVFFMVDAIQAIGRIDIDVNKMHIDALTAGGHKGLLATFGAGVLYCNEKMITRIAPTNASLQSVKNFSKLPAKTTQFDNLDWFDTARRFEAGNPNFNGIIAIVNGTSLLLELGVKEIEEHIRGLEEYFREKIAGLPLSVMQPKNPKNRGGVICVYHPAGKEKETAAILEKHKIICTMRNGYVRFSIDFYNVKEHMDEAYNALKEISELK